MIQLILLTQWNKRN